MALDITKKYTDNPFLDNLIYYVQQIAYSCILKDESVALANETDESSAAAEKFIYSKDGSGTFTMYDYTEEMMVEAGVPSAYIDIYLANIRDVPEEYQEALVEVARKNIIDNYEEKNNYYRMITGLPPYGDIGIPVAPYMYLIPENETVDAVYVHELGCDGARMFEKYGALDAIRQDYPEAKYLNFITAGIDIYKARRAVDKQILYSKSCGVVEIDDLFHDKFEVSRMFVDRAVDSDAMEFNSEHYNAFLCMYILFLTINDCVVELQDRIVKKDILDNRCCKFIFDMYGVPYYDSIPLKYQIILVKNINALVQYKSSPRDMLNLIMYFQATDVEINKYLLMRNRKYDAFGNPIYTTTDLIDSIENTILKRTTRTLTDITDFDNIEIPWPFLYFLNKGNKMYIWIDDIKQLPENYFIYDYDKLEFAQVDLDNTKSTHTIRFEFYYDKNTVDNEYNPDTSDPVKIHSQYFEESSPVVYEYDLDLPYEDYLNDGNDIIVSVNTLILHPSMYSVDNTTNKLTISSNIDLTDRKVNIIYVYSNNQQTKFYQDYVVASSDGQATFKIPEPFKYYTIHGNSFFITMGEVFIDPKRYTIDYVNATITFKNPSMIVEGRSIIFHFVYSKNSIYEEIDLHHTSETITATTQYQVEFTIHPPISNYDARGFKVYVELLDWYLDDSYYQVYGNKLVLTNLNMGLEIGDTITFHYYYTDTENNVNTIYKYYNATTKFQSEFIIDFPDTYYFEKGNKIIVDSAGIPLELGVDYTLNGNKVTILDPDYRPYLKQKLCVEYIYIEEVENSIKIFQSTEIVKHDNPIRVWMDVPFYPYQETGHNVLAFTHTLYVPEIYRSITDYSPYMEITDNIADIGENITFLYFCNKRYWFEKENLITVKEVTKTIDDVQNNILEVPQPFNNFIINDWPWFIDNNKVWMNEESYDLVNDSIAFIDDHTAQELQSFTFTFLYKNCAPWIFIDATGGTEGNEDLENDFNLYFLRIPFSTFTNLSTIVKKQEHVKSYDTFAIGDKFWLGPDGSNKTSNSRYYDVKRAILKKKFNYARTKYLTVDYLMDVSEASFQLAYFYSMLWDDVFKENKLNVRVSTLSNYHEFNIGHLFCYMTSLMYVFQNMEDKIFVKPSEILYARGFNFHADLGALKQWILDQRRRPEDYDVFGFMNPDPEFVDIDQFVETFNTNKNIYNTICDGLINANTYDIWCIWKKLHDSLMIWEFNLEYFKLSDGTQATTFTEFLDEKDPILHDLIVSIAAIEDDNSKRDTIIQNIQDIIYILDEWIDSDEFAYIYDQFPGASQRYLLEYLFTMINFFKSYKVYLYQMTINMKFNNPNDPELYIRPNDVHTMLISLDKLDYVSPREVQTMQVTTSYTDSITPRDIFTLKYVYEPGPIYDTITGHTVVYKGKFITDINGKVEIAEANIYYWNNNPISKNMANEIIGSIGIKEDRPVMYDMTGVISIKEEAPSIDMTGAFNILMDINADITGNISIPTKANVDMTGDVIVSVDTIYGNDLVIIDTNTYFINGIGSNDMGNDIDGSITVLAPVSMNINGYIDIPDTCYVPDINGNIDIV